LRRCLADLDRFGDIAAHDLQEPLRRIVSYAQLLDEHRTGAEDDESRFYLSQVIDESRRMRSLIGGLLSVTGPDSAETHTVPVAAQAALAQARARLSAALSLAGATMVVDRLPQVMGDETALVEIFSQLIDNALRYRSGARRLVIRVSAERRGDRIALLVGDNGVGIDPSKVARMFEPFYRALPIMRDAAEPSGTGLAVVRRLAERLGGRVWVESRPGEGSLFGVSLPAVTA
jgi:light-regulated signal transduction histidine kinase (bacteriophytochrome)